MNWNLNINKYLCNELHFKRLEADKFVYVKGSPHEKGDYVIIALYVGCIVLMISMSDGLSDCVIWMYILMATVS